MTKSSEYVQKEIKDNISFLIEKGDLQKASSLITEYENIINNDPDIYSIKGIIAILEGNLKKAECILKEGFILDGKNFDILYNLAYLYQSIDQDELAVKYYKEAFQNVKDENTQNEVYGILKELGIYESKEYLLKLIVPKTSIIILTYNNLEYNKLCIESIRKYTNKDTYEIVVVDNNSTDGTVDWLKKQKDLKLVLNDNNLGFPKGCNQGIEIANKDNDILLLNNDTVVTPNWLDNLKKCLYYNDTIGAVGSVTNSCSNYQAISVAYDNLDEMINFARNNNISNPSQWEERLRLVGFCMLIKNEVANKVGLLDELFSPGNFEDDDYSYRIRKAGYRLMLCKDSFIHHFGSVSFGKVSKEYNELLIKNKNKFTEKWGFDPYHIIEIRKDITELISKVAVENTKILHIGCAGGGTLLDIKNSIFSCQLYGIESIEQVTVNTDHFAQIETGSIEKIHTFMKNYFDFIIVTHPQRNENDIVNIINLIRGYLSDNGISYIVLDKKMASLDRKLLKALENRLNGYLFNINRVNDEKILCIKRAKNNALSMTVYKKEEMCKLYLEDIESKRTNADNYMSFLIKRLDNNIEFEKNLEQLRRLISRNNLDSEKIKSIILNKVINKIKLLNMVGILYYQSNTYNKALMFLKEAFKLNQENLNTIYNIAFVLHKLNKNKAALDFLKQINKIEKDLEIEQLKQQIEAAI